MRTKLSETAPAPEVLLPPAPAAVTLMSWPPIGAGRSTVTPARLKLFGRTCSAWEAPTPAEVRNTGFGTEAFASSSVAASRRCVLSTLIA